MADVDSEQLATVLEQIADHSDILDLRGHIRQVVTALRGDGLIFLNGPPQQEMRAGDARAVYAEYYRVMTEEGERMLGWDELEPVTRRAFTAVAAMLTGP